jgi:hypothetical protein
MTPRDGRLSAGDGGQLEDSALDAVWRVLNRDEQIASLEELRNGLNAERRATLEAGPPFALGFDTNATYRLGLGSGGADALDYLRAKHQGPVVVPGQTIQEIWNNLLSAVEPKAKRLRKKFEELEQEVHAIGQDLGASGLRAREAIDSLLQSHGEWIDPKSQSVFDETLDVLAAVGTCSYVPRARFKPLAEIRKSTKTPPGFQDGVGYGDFFVWADFLYGVALAKPDPFDAVVLVTNDVKSDWSRNGVTHPVLVAEACAVGGVPFRLWTLAEFHAFAKVFSR